MKILFDTNLWISFMIGKRLSSLADVLCRHDVEVYVCEEELDEIRRVIARTKFDKLISAETRYYFFEMVYDVCFFTDITVATGISGISGKAGISGNWYDLNGRRLSAAPTMKGLYIRNGKKVVIK